MFCAKCGAKLKDNVKFCTACGEPVAQAAPQNIEQAVTTTGDVTQMPPELPSQDAIMKETAEQIPEKEKKSKKNLFIMIGILAVVIIALVVAGIFGFAYFKKNSKIKEANAYLEEGDYESAIDVYEELLLENEKNDDLRMSLAKAYLFKGDYREAKRALNACNIDADDSRLDSYNRLMDLSTFNPSVTSVDTSAFPTVTLAVSQGGTLEVTADNINLIENGEKKTVAKVEQQKGITTITYTSLDTNESDEIRNYDMTITVDGITFSISGDYTTPHFADATIALLSTDVSQYPVVKAYFHVTGVESGAHVEGLTDNSFVIRESLGGGEYLEREIRKVALLDENEGLHIGLVADKSDSISEYNMEQIKTVMTEFVNKLDYANGDKAELIAFDSIVQQMCYYTDDVNLLRNGINNMSTDGRTAFYDAVYNGITHAALQGGARCVVAFTDGMDNESYYSASDVIAYAKEKQVPVYVIGVSYSVEENVLKNIAESTGGRYWFIEDLYDLEDIFNQIYQEQKKLYVVEYESESTYDPYGIRTLDIAVSGGGHKGDNLISFVPTKSIYDDGVGSHASQYEVITECTTWEEASEKCQQMGGHLATITSQEEMDKIVALAEEAGLTYVWLGGYTSYDDDGNVFGHWVTGEPFTYEAWCKDEPSRVDKDGTPEWYIMLWNIERLGGWSWNDQRNDPAAAVNSMQDKMGFICEYE